MKLPFNPRNWFWQIGGDTSKYWSSAARGYVGEAPSDQVTAIANEVELYDVLVKAGCRTMAPSRTFTVQEVRDAMLRIDAAATGDAADAASLAIVADNIAVTLPPLAAA